MLEYLRFNFLFLIDLPSGIDPAEDSSTISDVIGADCSAIGEAGASSGTKDSEIGYSGASSGTKELVSPKAPALLQAQIRNILHIMEKLYITMRSF